jgi:hypothetical protein
MIRFRKDSRIIVADIITFFERFMSTDMQLVVVPIVGILLAFLYHYSFNQGANKVLLVFQILCLFLFFSGLIYVLVNYLMGRKIRWPKTTLLISFVCLTAYWLPQGLDLTDEGRGILTAWLISDGYLGNIAAFRLWTYITSGLWMHIFEQPLILWSRIGHLVVVTGMVYTSYRILREYFTSNFVLPAVLLSGVVFSTFLVYTVDFNVLPSLFLLAGIYFLIRQRGRRYSTAYVRFGLSSFFFVLACLSNFSLIIFLPLFLAEFVYRAFFKSRENMVPALLGLLTGTGAVLLATWLVSISYQIDELFWSRLGSFGAQNIKVATSSGTPSPYDHSIGHLFNKYSLQWISLLWKSAVGSLIIGIWIFISIRLKKFYRFFVHILIASIALVLMNRMDFWWEGLLVAFNSLLITSFFLRLKWKKQLSLILWSVALFLGTYLSSNNGLVNVFFTGGSLLLIPTILLLVKDKLYRTGSHHRGLRFLTISSFFILLIFSLYKRPELVYRDMPRANLTSTFNNPKLAGIVSTSSRTSTIDSYLDFLEKNVEEDARILHINKVPMLDLLSGRSYRPLWKGETNSLGVDYLLSDNGPDYICINHKNPRNPNWPLSKKVCIDADRKTYEFHLELAQESFEEVFRNEALSLHRRLR